jgi:hypothetical protein
LSNAGSYFFEDRNNLASLSELNWPAIQTNQWQGCKDGKQAEFLLEHSFPWHLVEAIGGTLTAYLSTSDECAACDAAQTYCYN